MLNVSQIKDLRGRLKKLWWSGEWETSLAHACGGGRRAHSAEGGRRCRQADGARKGCSSTAEHEGIIRGREREHDQRCDRR